MYLRLLFSIVISILFLTQTASSQENVLHPKSPATEEAPIIQEGKYRTVSFGIEAGLNYNMYSQDLSWFPEVPLSVYNVYEKGTGISPYFAFLIDFPIGSNLGIQAKLAYDMRSMDNTYTGFRDFTEFNSGSIYDAEVKAENKITGADISISALLRYNITNEFVLTVGPMVSIPAGDYTQELTQTSLTEGVYFWDTFGNFSSVLVESDEIADVKTRIGIDLGLGYEIPLSSNLKLVPSIRLNYMFSNFHGDMYMLDDTRQSLYGEADLFRTDSKLHHLKFGLALWF